MSRFSNYFVSALSLLITSMKEGDESGSGKSLRVERLEQAWAGKEGGKREPKNEKSWLFSFY